jgi:hypothetical protein
MELQRVSSHLVGHNMSEPQCVRASLLHPSLAGTVGHRSSASPLMSAHDCIGAIGALDMISPMGMSPRRVAGSPGACSAPWEPMRSGVDLSGDAMWAGTGWSTAICGCRFDCDFAEDLGSRSHPTPAAWKPLLPAVRSGQPMQDGHCVRCLRSFLCESGALRRSGLPLRWSYGGAGSDKSREIALANGHGNRCSRVTGRDNPRQ